jgi:hypothetical protein
MTLMAASPVNIGSYRFVRLGAAVSNGLKIRDRKVKVMSVRLPPSAPSISPIGVLSKLLAGAKLACH